MALGYLRGEVISAARLAELREKPKAVVLSKVSTLLIVKDHDCPTFHAA